MYLLCLPKLKAGECNEAYDPCQELFHEVLSAHSDSDFDELERVEG